MTSAKDRFLNKIKEKEDEKLLAKQESLEYKKLIIEKRDKFFNQLRSWMEGVPLIQEYDDAVRVSILQDAPDMMYTISKPDKTELKICFKYYKTLKNEYHFAVLVNDFVGNNNASLIFCKKMMIIIIYLELI